MSFVKIFLFTASVSLVVPAAAETGMSVFSNGPARICYEAAEGLIPPVGQIGSCDEALASVWLSRRDKVATHVNRGILHLKRGDVSASLKDLDQAILLNPAQPEAYLNKGMALMQAGHPEAALPLFGTALEKNTHRPAYAYFGLGAANEGLGNVSAAYLNYRRASDAEPDWALPRKELARFMVRPK